MDGELFIVLREPGGPGVTNDVTTIHGDIVSARTEADRLCKQEHQRFYVLKAIEAVSPAGTPTVWETL